MKLEGEFMGRGTQTPRKRDMISHIAHKLCTQWWAGNRSDGKIVCYVYVIYIFVLQCVWVADIIMRKNIDV